MPKCTKCREVKEAGGFHKDSATKSGLSYWCKLCQSQYSKEWLNRPGNRERKHKISRKHEEKPEVRERRRQASSVYRKKNPDKVNKLQRERRLRCPPVYKPLSERCKKVKADRVKKHVFELSDLYIKATIYHQTGLLHSEITDSMVSVKCEQLRLSRALKTLKKEVANGIT